MPSYDQKLLRNHYLLYGTHNAFLSMHEALMNVAHYEMAITHQRARAPNLFSSH